MIHLFSKGRSLDAYIDKQFVAAAAAMLGRTVSRVGLAFADPALVLRRCDCDSPAV
jgi:hypothetical protein